MKRILIIIIILIIGSFYILTIRKGTTWGDDFCQYLAHAKNIVDHKPYDDTGYIFNPYNTAVGPRTYPPIFPLLLAPLYIFFGLNFTVMKLLEILLFLSSLFLLTMLFNNTLTYLNKILLLFIVAFNPIIWDFKDQILSEIPYTFFSILTIWFFIKYYQTEKNRQKQIINSIILGALIYLSCGTRSIGIIFIPSLLLYEIIKTKKVSYLFFITTGTLSIFIILQHQFIYTEVNYTDLMSTNVPYIIMLLNNIYMYFRWISFISWQPFPLIGVPLLIFMNMLIIIGYLKRVRSVESVTLVEIYVFLYMLILILLWPNVSLPRYFIPIYPFFIFYFLYGLQNIKCFNNLTLKNISYALFIIAISIVYILNFKEYNFTEIKEGVTMQETGDLFNFINMYTKKDDNIIFFKPRALALYTGRKSSALPKPVKGNYALIVNKFLFFDSGAKKKEVGSMDQANDHFLSEIISYINKINAKYVILSRFDPDHVDDLVEHDRAHFAEIFANNDFKVFKCIN